MYDEYYGNEDLVYDTLDQYEAEVEYYTELIDSNWEEGFECFE